MKTHDDLITALISRPGVKAEVERIEREEGELLDALLKARQEAGLTQAGLTQAGLPNAWVLMHQLSHDWNAHSRPESTPRRSQPCAVTFMPAANGSTLR